MIRFVEMEEIALSIYKLPDSTSSEKWLEEIEHKGLYNWRENLQIVENFDTLDLPEQIKERNKKLHTYCVLRIKTYELYYKGIKEDTDNYKEQIDLYDKEVQVLVNELSSQ